MRRLSAFLARLARAMRTLAKDEGIPRSLRVLAAIALLPIPGPVDELVLFLLAPLFLLYRKPLQEAWEAAGREQA
jgi:hypothetical protein